MSISKNRGNAVTYLLEWNGHLENGFPALYDLISRTAKVAFDFDRNIFISRHRQESADGSQAVALLRAMTSETNQSDYMQIGVEWFWLVFW